MSRHALPLADAPLLAAAARRTALLRSGLAALLLVLAAAAFAAAPTAGSARAAAAGSRGAVVVLDVSGSIDDRGSAEIQRTLADLIRQAGPGGRMGLVLFSDNAMETLPPSAPTASLQSFRRFFIAVRHPQRDKPGDGSPFSPFGAYGTASRTLDYPVSPWGISFSGGTAISSGLHEARADLARAGLHGGTVVLLSDLIDAPQDVPALKRELRAYASDPSLDLHVRALSTDLPQHVDLYRQFLGHGAVASAANAARPESLRIAGGSRFPTWLVALVAACALLLAANELLSAPLRWRTAEARA